LPKLPAVSGPETVRALERAGFVHRRQAGSHAILKHPDTRRTVSVPEHGARDLPDGTLRGILRDAGLSVEQFAALLR